MAGTKGFAGMAFQQPAQPAFRAPPAQEPLPELPMEPLIAAMMAFSRLSGLLLAMPGTASLPPIARLALGLPLTLVLYPAVENLHLPATVPLLIAGIALEVATGITMGMVVSMMVGAHPAIDTSPAYWFSMRA